MALLDHADSDTDDDDEGTGPGGKPTAKDAKKKHRDNLLVIGIALVGVILTYLIWRSQKNASANTQTTVGNAVPSSGLLAGGSSSTNATDPNAEAGLAQLQSQFGQQSDALSGLQTAIGNLTAEVQGLSNTPSGSTGAPPQTPSAPSATPGYGYINLPGIGQSVILGSIGAGDQYSGYNVGGGAPVYFGNANGATQGSGQETVGSFAYVPVGYQSLVGASPTTETLPGSH